MISVSSEEDHQLGVMPTCFQRAPLQNSSSAITRNWLGRD
jgi:hypothetical protein